MKEKIKSYQEKPPLILNKRMRNQHKQPAHASNSSIQAHKRSLSLSNSKATPSKAAAKMGMLPSSSAPKLSTRFLVQDLKKEGGYDREETQNIVQTLKNKVLLQTSHKLELLAQENIKLKEQLNNKQFEVKKMQQNLDDVQNTLQMFSKLNLDRQKTAKLRECELIEAQIVTTNEKINLIEVEKNRMEVIVQVLTKNPANNPDFINQLEQTSVQITKLVDFESNVTKKAKTETEQAIRAINEITQKLEKKIKERTDAHFELEKYLLRLGHNMQSAKEGDKEMMNKLQQIRAQNNQDIGKHFASNDDKFPPSSARKLRGALASARSARRPRIDVSKTTGQDKAAVISGLQEKIKKYNIWVMKLRVSSHFLNETKARYTQQFGQLTASTSIQNPNDLESFDNILVRSQELRQLIVKKEDQAASMRTTSEALQKELKALEGQVGPLQDNESEDHGGQALPVKQQELHLKRQKIKETRLRYEQKMGRVAEVKSAFVNLAKKLKMSAKSEVHVFRSVRVE